MRCCRDCGSTDVTEYPTTGSVFKVHCNACSRDWYESRVFGDGAVTFMPYYDATASVGRTWVAKPCPECGSWEVHYIPASIPNHKGWICDRCGHEWN